jgi:hypothetical protein
MKNLMLFSFLCLISIITLFSGCGKVVIDATSPTSTANLPSSYSGNYIEVSVPVPSDARRSGATIDEVTFYYTAVNEGGTATTAKVYVAPAAPPITDQGQLTQIADLSLNANETVEGSSTDPILSECIKNNVFTVRFERTGASSNIKLTCYVKVKVSIDFIAYYTGQ